MASIKRAKSGKKTIVGSEGPQPDHKKQIRAFQKRVGELAVEHGLAANAADVNCRWEPRLVNGELRWVWVCD